MEDTDLEDSIWNCNNTEELQNNLSHLEDPTVNVDIIWKNILKDNEKPEIKLPRSVRYIPGKHFFPKTQKSFLTKANSEICLNVLSCYKSGRTEDTFTPKEKQELAIYKELADQIKQENTVFLEFAKSEWQKSTAERFNIIKTWVYAYSDKLWKVNLKRSLLYPENYSLLKVALQLSYNQMEPPIAVHHVKDLLHIGQVARYTKPELFVKRLFQSSSAPDLNSSFTYNSKLPVSLDENIVPLVNTNDVDVVISSSALKMLMDDSDFKVPWDIPIVVKSHGTKRIVYIDKPLANKFPTAADFNRQYYKRLIKTNYCIIPVIDFQMEAQRENLGVLKSPKPCNSEERTVNNSSPSMSDNKDGGIINNKILHNASYRLWNISLADKDNKLMKTQISRKNIKFLVRSKTDACQVINDAAQQAKACRPRVLVPKWEYQIEFGANISTKSELIRQWTDLFFRPNADLCRVRIASHNSEIIAFESVNLQQINTEAHVNYEYKPVLRLGVLYKIFSNLIELEAGNYLLSHDSKQGPFVNVFKSCEAQNMDKKPILNLHDAYAKKNCYFLQEVTASWIPIDVHYILPQNEAYKTMPGLFPPLENWVANRIIRNKKKLMAKRQKKGSPKKTGEAKQ